MAHEKRVVLKDQTLITTEEMYQRVKTYEDATAKKRAKSGGAKKRKRVSRGLLNSMNDAEGSKETNEAEILDVIEVAME